MLAVISGVQRNRTVHIRKVLVLAAKYPTAVNFAFTCMTSGRSQLLSLLSRPQKQYWYCSHHEKWCNHKANVYVRVNLYMSART